jgi:hypothetical protein
MIRNPDLQHADMLRPAGRRLPEQSHLAPLHMINNMHFSYPQQDAQASVVTYLPILRRFGHTDLAIAG